MTDEAEEDGQDLMDLVQSVPEHVTCHNHVILFPWGSDTFAAHLKALAIRIEAASGYIEVFDQDEHHWKPAEKKSGNVASIHTGRKP